MYRITVLHGEMTPHASATLLDKDSLEHADAYVASKECPYRHLLDADDVYETVEDAITALTLERVDLIAANDACYSKVKSQYAVFPSARASQAIAKCRKKNGNVRKGKKGANLKRWQREKWKDKITGKPCGHKGGPEYCRPTKRVSKDTPKMYSGKKLESNINKKKSGQRAS